MIDQFAKEKIIKVYLAKEIDVKKLEEIGTIKEIKIPQVTISVPRTAAAVAAAELLQNFPVADLTIEEEPIEDIIRKVFKGEVNNKE